MQRILFIVLATIALVRAAPFWRIASREASLPPSQDAFYFQPNNIASYKPGQVIRNRTITPQLTGTISGRPANANLKVAYQYVYRSTDSLGKPVAAVNTLLVPDKNADSTKLLSYQEAYDSASNDCSPSYLLRPSSNATASNDEVMIIAALQRGWYVVTSDYEGLQAQFTAGKQAGYAVLDSVRAVFNQAKTNGLSTKAKYALWGYSGGALASEWASELQPSYAPELRFQGAALGGLTPNVSSVLYTINGGPAAGLAISGIAGLARIWPNATKWLDQEMIPSKKQEFFDIASKCSTLKDGAMKNMGDYFKNGLQSFSQKIPQQLMVYNGVMGSHGTPRHPLYFYKAAQDEVSVVADTDALYNSLCSRGATIEYYRNAVGDHITEAVTGAGGAIEWISDRLNGNPVSHPGKCNQETVAESQLDIQAFQGLSDVLIAQLQSVL